MPRHCGAKPEVRACPGTVRLWRLQIKDPESMRIVSIGTPQIKVLLPTEEEYLKDIFRVWREKKSAVALRHAGAPAAKQVAAFRSQPAQGKNALIVASQRAKQLQ
ncbi:hypothetical protein HPB50_006732 [Hyalomma asiaticum]|uniref:Uncharacterized protein n=1 Tax=Hyalomma asiaticum TaxID=266040 RepID=A0ACB7TFI9_HYAAI|nr:hypothetical protein HPB50_006732 [Hyalomma asiaticum]